MKTRTKILLPTIVLLAIVSFYLYITENGYSTYHEGISLKLYSDHKLQEFLNRPESQDFPITKITDDDLADTPELKKLITQSLSKGYPLNDVGRVPITFEDLNNFHYQYAEILAEKYSKNPKDFFKTDNRHMPEEYLAKDPNVHLRTFEGNYFEYEGKQYGIQPDTLYIPFVEDEDLLHLEVYKTNSPLREDHTWADLTEKGIDLESKIIVAIADIGQHQENIEVQTFGLSPATMTKYENWKENTLGDGFMFEYKDRFFSIGFLIA